MPRMKTTINRKRFTEEVDNNIDIPNKIKPNSKSFVPLVQMKHLTVSRRILNEYVEQSSSLPVAFKCEDGVMRCSGRMLMLSDFWTDMIVGTQKFGQSISFDFSTKSITAKCYPKKVIKYFLDSIHLAACDELELLDVLLVLDFLKSEGRQDSELEQDMVQILFDGLQEMNFDLGTQLLIALFMEYFHDKCERQADYIQKLVLPTLNVTSLTRTLIEFNPNNELHSPIIQYMNDNEMYAKYSPSKKTNIEFAILQLGKSFIKDKRKSAEYTIWVTFSIKDDQNTVLKCGRTKFKRQDGTPAVNGTKTVGQLKWSFASFILRCGWRTESEVWSEWPSDEISDITDETALFEIGPPDRVINQTVTVTVRRNENILKLRTMRTN